MNLQPFFLALQFLTRIPVPQRLEVTDSDNGYSILFYPLVGLIIGSLLGILAFFLQPAAVSIQAAVILTCWVFFTGALHLDGLADCADAWVGGMGDRERSLAIMKDPAAGPIAVVVLVTLLLLKWSAISEGLQQGQYQLLLLTPVAGRLTIIGLMLTTRYIRQQGLGGTLLEHLPRKPAMLLLAGGCMIVSFGLGIAAVLVGLLVFLWLRWTAIKRLGGVTGDVYGAGVELVEVAVLITATAWK